MIYSLRTTSALFSSMWHWYCCEVTSRPVTVRWRALQDLVRGLSRCLQLSGWSSVSRLPKLSWINLILRGGNHCKRSPLVVWMATEISNPFWHTLYFHQRKIRPLDRNMLMENGLSRWCTRHHSWRIWTPNWEYNQCQYLPTLSEL